MSKTVESNPRPLTGRSARENVSPMGDIGRDRMKALMVRWGGLLRMLHDGPYEEMQPPYPALRPAQPSATLPEDTAIERREEPER